jgi:BirA family transcriptional regulator, biotin operon repressor / biotin---[acetyl-CoA-carboxylase] ligase
MSFLLRPRSDPALWPALTALVALSTVETLEAFFEERPRTLSAGEVRTTRFRAAVKWPNDVFGSRGKLAGILAETAGNAVVVGIGINIGQLESDFPAEIRGSASSLRLEGLEPVADTDEVALRFNDRLTREYSRFEDGDRAFLQAGLRERFFLRGARVRLEGHVRPVEGVAVDIGPLGEIVLDTREGLRRFVSGEIVRWEGI